MKIAADFHSFELLEDELQAVTPDGQQVSKHYTSHTWTKDPMHLLVSTAEGDILVCDLKSG